jgi:hypothetical protein
MVNRVKQVDHSEVETNLKNPNKGTERGSALVRRSIQDYGFGRPILLDKGHKTIAGNHTLEAAIELGLPITIVETYGDEIIAHVRKDLDLDSEDDSKARELAVMDNRATIEGTEWDIEVLQSMADSGDNLLSSFWPEELEELGVIMDRKKLTPVNFDDEDPQKQGDYHAENIAPGVVYYLGNHELHVGYPTKRGDISVMLKAWEDFTGEKVSFSEDGSFDEFADFSDEDELL